MVDATGKPYGDEYMEVNFREEYSVHPHLFKPLNLELPHEKKTRIAKEKGGTVKEVPMEKDTRISKEKGSGQQVFSADPCIKNVVRSAPGLLGPSPQVPGTNQSHASRAMPSSQAHAHARGVKGVSFATPVDPPKVSPPATLTKDPSTTAKGNNPGAPKLSYAQTLAGPSSSVAFPGISLRTHSERQYVILPEVTIEDKVPIFHRGTPGVIFKKTEMQQLSKLDNFLLIGKFSHGRPDIATLRNMFGAQFLLRETDLNLPRLTDPRNMFGAQFLHMILH